MGETQTFTIKRALTIPLALLTVMTLALLVICLVQGQPVAKAVILVGLLIALGGIFVECAGRRLVVSSEGITAIRPFRSKHMLFSAVTSLETVKVRSRVFLTLSAGDDEYLIISNGYAEFPGLLHSLIEAVPAAVVTEETRQLAARPPQRAANAVAVWLAVIAMAYILVAQFVTKG